jgi:hypothetical protein
MGIFKNKRQEEAVVEPQNIRRLRINGIDYVQASDAAAALRAHLESHSRMVREITTLQEQVVNLQANITQKNSELARYHRAAKAFREFLASTRQPD